MTIKVEKSLRDFQWWSGAKTNAAMLSLDELDELEAILDEEEEWDETGLNDLMWFEFPYICELLGLEYDEDSGEVVRNED